MAFTAGVNLVDMRGAGENGGFIECKAATVAATPQTILFAPFSLTNPTNASVLRDVGPNDTAGALTVVSISASGITFTPASTGQVTVFVVGGAPEMA